VYVCVCVSIYSHEWEGNMTYKYFGFGLDTGIIEHLPLTTLLITI
jgi:hypothetical protein